MQISNLQINTPRDHHARNEDLPFLHGRQAISSSGWHIFVTLRSQRHPETLGGRLTASCTDCLSFVRLFCLTICHFVATLSRFLWTSLRVLRSRCINMRSIVCSFTRDTGFYRAMLCIRGTSHGPLSSDQLRAASLIG